MIFCSNQGVKVWLVHIAQLFPAGRQFISSQTTKKVVHCFCKVGFFTMSAWMLIMNSLYKCVIQTCKQNQQCFYFVAIYTHHNQMPHGQLWILSQHIFSFNWLTHNRLTQKYTREKCTKVGFNSLYCPLSLQSHHKIIWIYADTVQNSCTVMKSMPLQIEKSHDI